MRSMVLLILFAVVTAAPVQFAEEWNAWKSLHGRSYSSEEVGGVRGRGEESEGERVRDEE